MLDKKKVKDTAKKTTKTKKTQYLLELNNITKKFGSFVALDNISFNLKKGERVGIIGGNGAGKTTLTELIAGVTKKTFGELNYGFKYKVSPKERIGMQFQQSTFPSGLTTKDLIKFAINLRKLKLTDKHISDLLDIFQMKEFYTRKVKSLSGGQRQKINILLSVIHNPELVILDELSTGLDIFAREEIFSFIDKLLESKKITAILISHHLDEIEQICDRAIFLTEGKIIADVNIKEVLKKHKNLGQYYKSIIKSK